MTMNATAQHEEPGWDLNLCRGTIREHWRCIPKALEKVWDIPAIKAGLGADTDAPVNIPAQHTSRAKRLDYLYRASESASAMGLFSSKCFRTSSKTSSVRARLHLR